MPLLIGGKDVNWRETKQKININVHFRTRVEAKVSVLATSKYLKVNSSPWFWECFLAASVDPCFSVVRIDNDTVSFELRKKIPAHWNQLEDSRKDDAQFCKEQREAAFEEHQTWLQENQESKSKKQREIHQASVRKQMDLEDRERKAIEKQKRIENERVALEIKKVDLELKKAQKISQQKDEILRKMKAIPPTRTPGHITVNFTPRVFPTAARESQEPEEKEWLEKQTAAAVSLELDCTDLSPKEKNPEWLKEKAESLYKKGDNRGSVQAYSLAIRMCPNLYSLYLGRSACHLNLRNLHKCIEDSSKALELLQPAVSSNTKDRKEAHRIRGLAFHQLNLPVEGLMDIEAALKIDPDDDELKKNARILRELVENSH
ncbi:dynein axonemal assembly factor 4-like [Uloborus diversus]|uniref:dynein axonemal assembly factor 4-like n=1 Tax=Uloborus diversus TaxID=327109 RepID=UPI00240923D3|nr:dynein axonemal assembly factor 4-like [Uloborus diversus]